MKHNKIKQMCFLKSFVQKLFLSKLVLRICLGAVMLNAFLFLANRDKVFLYALTIFISCGISYEITSMTMHTEVKFPISPIIASYFFAILYCHKVFITFIQLYSYKHSAGFILNLKIVTFCLYAIGLIFFVSNLEKTKLSKQLLVITVIHTISYISSLTTSLAIKIIYFNKFFYIFPALLVITNDIGAYFVGKFFGKTPLIAISPKKTFEGFFGGFACTFLIGILCVYLKLHGILLPDSSKLNLDCIINPQIWYLNFPVFYLHGISFICAASFLAPFSGFIASAIKRAFKKKDFGILIPGHGGLTDRMDCQIIMVYFAFYYLKATRILEPSTSKSMYNYILSNLSKTEFYDLKKLLADHE